MWLLKLQRRVTWLTYFLEVTSVRAREETGPRVLSSRWHRKIRCACACTCVCVCGCVRVVTHTRWLTDFPRNVVCTHLDVERRLSLPVAQNGAQKYIKVVRLFSTGEKWWMVISFFCAYTFVSFVYCKQKRGSRHERATFLRPFSRLCVPANNVQIGTY